MTVLMFQPRFAAPILDGTKKQTIRPPRKRPIEVGDLLSLRRWEGKAYRSAQIEIKTVKVIGVFEISIYTATVNVGTPTGPGWLTASSELDKFARGDGFESWKDMVGYLTAPGGYGLPFTGILIQWE